MSNHSLKELVGPGKLARFLHLRAGVMTYTLDDGFRFEVPVSELGDASVHAEERAMVLMKWIKRSLDKCQPDREVLAAVDG